MWFVSCFLSSSFEIHSNLCGVRTLRGQWSLETTDVSSPEHFRPGCDSVTKETKKWLLPHFAGRMLRPSLCDWHWPECKPTRRWTALPVSSPTLGPLSWWFTCGGDPSQMLTLLIISLMESARATWPCARNSGFEHSGSQGSSARIRHVSPLPLLSGGRGNLSITDVSWKHIQRAPATPPTVEHVAGSFMKNQFHHEFLFIYLISDLTFLTWQVHSCKCTWADLNATLFKCL